MKKYTIIALLSFITLLGVAQTKTDTIVSKVQESVLKSIPDSSALTFKEVYADIKSGLSALGSALKIGSEHVYTVLVKQQIANSIVYTIIFIISLLAYFPLKSILMKAWDADKPSNYHDRFGSILAVTFGVIGYVLLIIYNINNINIIITGFINPEYGAIKEVLNIIK